MAAAAGEDGAALYKPGAARSSDLGGRGLGAYLTRSGALCARLLPSALFIDDEKCSAGQARGQRLRRLKWLY